MDKEQYAAICQARGVLCNFCEADECEKCIVTRLVDDAANEYEEEE